MTGPAPSGTGFDGLTGAPPAGVRTIPPESGSSATRLVLVRHGEAVCNTTGVCGGPRGCSGLTETGVAQVSQLRDRLVATGELSGAALYASVLPRAVETANIVSGALAPPGEGAPEVRADCGLCELHPGEADGLTWGEYAARFDQPDWDVDPDTPLAPGAESWTTFVARASGALEDVAARHPGGLVVVATHAGVIEASMLAFLPIAGGRDGARLGLRTRHASITTWEVDVGRWRLLGYNDGAHGLVGAGAPGHSPQQA